MNGSACSLIDFMKRAQTVFIIPVYQRNYAWKTENCKQLFDDLVKVIKDNRKSHFFGSIVSTCEQEGLTTLCSIIDGQQRLTTVSLIFLAIYNLVSKGILKSQNNYIGEQIYEMFLINKFQPEETRIKLKPVKNDRIAFARLLDDEDDCIEASNITSNYNYFKERIKKEEITIDELFNAISRLEIINIDLRLPDDNPQLIFESLNSTGLDLSEGDKIRNFILMNLPADKQEQYYDKYWNRIEVYTNYDVSLFVRDYLSIKQFTTPAQRKIYADFKEFVESASLEIVDLLEDMLKYAKRYEVLLKCNSSSKTLNNCIYRLNRLETTVTRPFLLDILRLYDDEKLSMDDLEEIFSIVESYIFRRNICGIATNSLNKIFLLLHKEIIRYDGTDKNYVEKFKYALCSKKESARFPDNREFKKEFMERSIYQMSKNRIYVLERLENFGTLETKNVYENYTAGEYSIEHIMPQRLTPSWEKALGDDYEEIHETWLHRAANLTLTAYNSKYSNMSFQEKKTMENGLEDSGFRMNTYIAKKDKWTLAELEERSEYLGRRALEIWPMPVTEYAPAKKQMDSYTLDDDTSLLTGRTIVKFSYKNTERPVDSWVEAYQKMLQILYAEDKNIINKLANSSDENLRFHFTTTPDDHKRCVKIGDDIFIWVNTNTKSKLSALKKIFDLYDADPSDLVFYLRDDNEKNQQDMDEKHVKRRRHWAYVLDFIKKYYKEDNPFSNVTASNSKGNWICGFIGINGFYLCCVSNYSLARVELYLAKRDIIENKQAFDTIMQHKNEIERTLKVPLTWQRGNDIKSSKISYSLNDVNIENEADWPKMAEFHAEWSKKFYDVIVPYLK